MVGQHLPRRPEWTCVMCEAEWPCRARKDQLQREGAGKLTVALLMSDYFLDAQEDMRTTDAKVLYLRFLGWVGRH